MIQDVRNLKSWIKEQWNWFGSVNFNDANKTRCILCTSVNKGFTSIERGIITVSHSSFFTLSPTSKKCDKMATHPFTAAIVTTQTKVNLGHLQWTWAYLFPTGVSYDISNFQASCCAALSTHSFCIGKERHHKVLSEWTNSPDVRLACVIWWFVGGSGYDILTTYAIAQTQLTVSGLLWMPLI